MVSNLTRVDNDKIPPVQSNNPLTEWLLDWTGGIAYTIEIPNVQMRHKVAPDHYC